MTKRLSIFSATFLMIFLPVAASAHVVVKPAEAGISAFQTFTVSVPNEKNQAAVGLRLVIPAGLKSISPNVKPGWTITEKQSGSDADGAVTEINWSGGQIPAGQRDDFLFSGQAPATATELHWKAYQTYADGTIVSWDQTPSGKDDESETPYSITKVVNDLASAPAAQANSTGTWQVNAALVMSALALVAAAGALMRKR